MLRFWWLQSPKLDSLCLDLGYHQSGLLGRNHPKVTTLSFLCHRGDGKGKRDLMQGSGSERWMGDDLQGVSLAAGRSWAPFKMAAAAFKGPF